MRLKSIKLGIVTLVIMSLFSAGVFADSSIHNFIKLNDYISGAFDDVPNSAWYVHDVQTVYELGLMIIIFSLLFI